MSDNSGTRLAAFRKSLGISQRVLSDSLGFSQGVVAQVETSRIQPSREFLQKISDRYGVSADWLLNGVGDMLRPVGPGFQGDRHRIDPPDPGRPLGGDFTADGVAYALVPRFDLALSAGPGRNVPDETTASAGIALPRQWFLENGVTADFCRLVRVRGDSMAPSIPDGATILIDGSQRLLRKAGIYAFTRGGDVFVKRLLPAIDTSGKPVSVTILSDNPAFAPTVVTGSDMNALAIQGLVRAVLTVL
jgi:phage repressor protein C with HTH and peptisase S24 domain